MKRIIEVDLILSAWLVVAPFMLIQSSGRVIGEPIDILLGVLGVMLLIGAAGMLAEPPWHVGLALYESACGVCAMVTAGVLHGQLPPALAANSFVGGTAVVIAGLANAWFLLHQPQRVD